ncbi:probable indole-3-acetic acid-amido synthetase GH3.6 [Dioscorea cayenensis subsp. rotundata]|uniref:Probable indole-3-acetic acid-amido synthetase GH3.6 n=1 Tax=Dioscorea cayennensis subsp. rotundata TaxID=55577 RepID=A0AB40BKA3_DIOCR|nr:probable indole-3-acetic acid-amido synthetase GH3.6 [Dioscorea cayenensis subsp. rotundata]
MENFQLMLNENEMGEVVEYAGYLELDSKQQHLVVFVEIINTCCLGSVYQVRRAGGSLGCLEIAIVRAGSFEGLAMVAMENGAPANQYKPPKIIRNLKLVSLLRDCVIASYCY